MVLFLFIILIMISVYWRPMWGILRGLLLGFLFLIGGSSLNIPVPVSFVVFVLYCQLGTPWLRKTNYRQTKATRTFHESTTTDADHSTYTTEQYYYAYEVDGTDYTNVLASIRIIRSCMRKPKAQNVKFSTIRKSRRRCSARKISQKITTRYGFSGS